MASKREDEIAEEIKLRKAQLAEEGAARFFNNLLVQVGRDIARYHQLGGDRSVHMDEPSARGFKVRKPMFPAVALKVELKTTAIEYSYYEKLDDTSPSGWQQIQRFQLIADLNGNVQARQGAVTFINESEVSAALLKLVFS